MNKDLQSKCNKSQTLSSPESKIKELKVNLRIFLQDKGRSHRFFNVNWNCERIVTEQGLQV